MSDSFWSLHIGEVINALILVATVAAITYGPVFALNRSASKEVERESHKRRRDLVAALMKTRRMFMHPGHIAALNLIQLEYSNSNDVMELFRSYIRHLGDVVPAPGNDQQNFLARREDIFVDLLHAMGKTIGVEIDRMEIKRLAYLPIGVATEEEQQRRARQLLLETLEGRRGFPVVQFGSTAPPNPYPPAPVD